MPEHIRGSAARGEPSQNFNKNKLNNIWYNKIIVISLIHQTTQKHYEKIIIYFIVGFIFFL